MLKKLIITLYVGAAVFLMSFAPATENTTEKTTFQSPTEVSWKLLGQIDFVKQKNPYYGEVMYPMINGTLKALQGKKIKASGFIVPIDSKSYALSKIFFRSCFSFEMQVRKPLWGFSLKVQQPN